ANFAILKAMKAAWNQKLIREKRNRQSVTINVAISKTAKQQLDRIKEGTLGETIERLVGGETNRLKEEKHRLATTRDKHKSELARAREAIDQLYRDLQEVTRELSAARAAVRESKSLSELSDDQRVQAKSIFDQRMEGI